MYLLLLDFKNGKPPFGTPKRKCTASFDRPQTFRNVADCKTCQDEQMVDVHFLTGTETTGFNLHINGEGAGREAGMQGSREAVLSVFH